MSLAMADIDPTPHGEVVGGVATVVVLVVDNGGAVDGVVAVDKIEVVAVVVDGFGLGPGDSLGWSVTWSMTPPSFGVVVGVADAGSSTGAVPSSVPGGAVESAELEALRTVTSACSLPSKRGPKLSATTNVAARPPMAAARASRGNFTTIGGRANWQPWLSPYRHEGPEP